MASQTLTLTPVQTTDAQFRAWGSAISAALATQGLVQTADTGQVNWVTVVKSASTNTASGYEIWRFNDSLQSSAPVFLKIEYGNANTTAVPQMWVTVGTGSDGAGTITGTNIAGVYGAITTRRAISPTTAATATPGNVYVNGNSGCLALLAWPSHDSGYGGFLLLVERWRNWDGTNNADGVTVLSASSQTGGGNNTAQSLCFVPNLATNPGTSATIGANGLVVGAGMALLSAAIGTTLYPLPVMTGPGPRSGAPSKFVLAVGLGDYPTLGVITMSHYGISETWLAAGIGATSGSNWGVWGPSGSNINSFLFRTS